MQFHLDGFQPGDPAIADPARRLAPLPAPRPLPDTVDVLIVGCGPAGLTLAAQLAAFPEIDTRIIEAKTGPLLVGQADGIACRSMEMFNAFGFAHRVLAEAYWVNETCFWKPDPEADPDGPARIARSGRIEDTEEGLSEFPHVILNQARVHDFYLDTMRNAPARLEPDYGCQLLDIAIDSGPDAPEHPVTVTISRSDPEGGEARLHTLRARHVVGCDGARSQVRRSIGRTLEGDAANQAWGVMDVLLDTDFPDIRLKCLVQSADQGNLVIIPREGGYLVRLYIELDKLAEDERVASRNITVDTLIAAAGRILSPYRCEVKEVAWWSVYEIGQRLCDRFDDLPADADPTRLPRVFIAGDACHTHSPKAGQGMNVSMRDGFNLGWKLASVLTGRCDPAILHSYSGERVAVAQELIAFDRAFAKMLSSRPKRPGDPEGEGVDPAEVQAYFTRHGRFTAGTAVQYRPSVLTGPDTHQALASGFAIGTRFHSAPVVRLADAKPMHLGHVVQADGRWRLFAFADRGDPAAQGSRLWALCHWLENAPASPLLRHTPEGADPDAVIDLRAVLQQPHRQITPGSLHPLLMPRKGRLGLRDHEKVFCADPAPGADIFDQRGIDRNAGCMVLVRPDQHVSHVLPLDATGALADFLAGFMRPAR